MSKWKIITVIATICGILVGALIASLIIIFVFNSDTEILLTSTSTEDASTSTSFSEIPSSTTELTSTTVSIIESSTSSLDIITTTSDITSTESTTVQETTEESTTNLEITPEITSTDVPERYDLYSRDAWTGTPLNSAIKELSLPILRVIVAHTADSVSTCATYSDCIARIQSINATNSHLLDIPYNYFIGGDGNVYEGRGYRHEGEHTNNLYGSNYNDIGIGIAFIGTYENESPTQRQIDALNDFLNDLMENNTLSSDYKVFYQDQLMLNRFNSTALNDQVKLMYNFYDLQKIYTREEWGAQNPCGLIDTMENPQNRSIIYHTDTPWMCYDFANCTRTLVNIQSGIINACNINDVPYAFTIGGNSDFSMLMEVRGFSYMGSHFPAYNRWSIAVGLIGEFDSMIPGAAMMSLLEQFLKDAVALGKLTEDYILSPRYVGQNVINIIRNWPHFAPLP